MIKPIAIIRGAAVIWWASYLLLRKDKDKPALLGREVYEDRVSDITYKAKPKETFKL
ncbi:hypothetical protein ACS2Q8_25815 [Bacillus cereus group sp. Bce007]|uniref:hypothetical protein n=1 Tax=Bacillus cereus group sp. Bce007 TaxID=3445254 RepID=UPI003F21E28F